MLLEFVREHSVKFVFGLLGLIVTGGLQLRSDVNEIQSDHKVINKHTEDFERNLDRRLATIETDVREIRDKMPDSGTGGLSRKDTELLTDVLDSIARRNCFESGGTPGDNTPLCRGIN